MEFQADRTIAGCAHSLEFTFTLAQFLDNGTGEFFRNINVSDFHWFKFLAAFVCVIQNFRFTYCEFITLTAHVLDQDRKVKFTTSGNLETFGSFSIFYTKADICIELTVQTVT